MAFCTQVQTQLSMSVSKVLFEWGELDIEEEKVQ